MPRRIKTQSNASPPPSNNISGTPPLRGQVAHVLEVWTHSDEHTDQTRTRMSETVHRFSRYAAARGVMSLAGVTEADVRAFITAPTGYGTMPELATQHARRTALRTLYRTARRLSLASGDPTLDVQLPPRGCRVARPLTDDEVTLCRASALATRGNGSSVRATAWALGEATAISSEIAAVRVRDLDDPAHPRRVHLPGTRRHDPRAVDLTPWGSSVLRQRAAALLTQHDPDVLLAYGGHAPSGGAKAQASVCNALREVLASAGLLRESDIRPASVRHWAGRTAYDQGIPIEHVALLLGLRSLDAAAEDIGLDWRSPDRTASPAARGSTRADRRPSAEAAAINPRVPAAIARRHLAAVPIEEELQ